MGAGLKPSESFPPGQGSGETAVILQEETTRTADGNLHVIGIGLAGLVAGIGGYRAVSGVLREIGFSKRGSKGSE